MQQLYYQPEGYWFGDCMPFYHDGLFYLYHQRDTRRPGPFGEPFGWSLARTSDFVHYEDMGEALIRGGDDAQDQFIFAGSVFEANGVFYAMYTGFNRDYPQQGKPSQVMMIAKSDDLIHWNKTTETVAAPQAGYDPDNWRDPYIFWSEEHSAYIMILGARKLDGQKLRTGRTVWFTSPDLSHWAFQGDFWAPNLFFMHEMPDLFKMGNYWYLLTTEYSEQSKTVYRMSKSLNGPWLAPVDDAFDGRAYYAARTCSDGHRRYLFGWVPTKEHDDDLGNFQWGGTLVVHEVYQREDGTLGVKAPEGVQYAFTGRQSLTRETIRLASQDSVSETCLTQVTGDLYQFEAKLTFSAGTRAIGIRLGEDAATGDAYEFKVLVGENRLIFDRTPNLPWFRCMNKGLERPLRLQPGQTYPIRLIVDGSIATLYIDGVALNTRMYAKAGQALSIYEIDGDLTVENAAIATSLTR